MSRAVGTNRLRATSESLLALCLAERGEFERAQEILRRGLDLVAPEDTDRRIEAHEVLGELRLVRRRLPAQGRRDARRAASPPRVQWDAQWTLYPFESRAACPRSGDSA